MKRSPVGGRAAWTGEALAASTSWVRDLSPSQAATLESAARAAEARGLDWRTLARDDFPLPGWEALVEDVRAELEHGLGLCKLRGVPVQGLSMNALRLTWMGLGRHLGTPLSQDTDGLLMRDIVDEGADVARRFGALPSAGGSFLSSRARALSRAPLRFHTDRADVVGLFCVGRPRSGGDSLLASTVAIHDAMLERRPDLLELLYRPVYRSRLGEERGGQWSVYALPVFGLRDGKFTSHYSRTYVEAAQLLPGVPRMTEAQWQALDLLASLAEELSFRMSMAPGEIQLLNNHVVYHARDAYEDDAEAGLVRRLMRLWLAMPDSRALPEDHAVLWREVAAGAPRGGILPVARACTAAPTGPAA